MFEKLQTNKKNHFMFFLVTIIARDGPTNENDPYDVWPVESDLVPIWRSRSADLAVKSIWQRCRARRSGGINLAIGA